MHDVERAQLRVRGDEHSPGMMAKYLATSLAIENVVSEPPRHQELLLADLHLDELGRVGVEVHHVAGLPWRPGFAVHRDGHVGLSQSRGVVRPVARHRHEAPAGLQLADQAQFSSPVSPSARKSSTPASAGDRGGRERMSPGYHDRLDSHRAELGETFADPALDDVP